jgi:uridylate kinase
MKIAISLGGSLLTGKSNDPYIKLDPVRFKQYAKVIKKLHEKGHELMVVCGGGKPARYFIEMAKKYGAESDVMDFIGIKSSHINALLFMAALGDIAEQPKIYEIPELGFDKREKGKIWIGGGHKPGVSTDYRAVQFAKAMKADIIINATDIDGVYTKNPKIYNDAEKLPKLSFDQLKKIIKENTCQAPGEYGLFDMEAVKLSKNLGIPVVIIDGRDPEEIVRAVNGTHKGSTIS